MKFRMVILVVSHVIIYVGKKFYLQWIPRDAGSQYNGITAASVECL
jgi:hypothetical protein